MRIHPSILSADFANLQRDIEAIATADAVHVDVMDGHFVPNLTIGLPVVARLREISPIPFDVHLMIERAGDWAPRYADAGAECVTFHIEAAGGVEDAVTIAAAIRASGAMAGVAVKPATAIEPLLDRLDAFDLLLVMTVEPGFGGQSFMADQMPKVEAARAAIAASGIGVLLEVDGGVDTHTLPVARAAGADTFVAGSAVYRGAGDGSAARGASPADRIAALRVAAN